MKAIKLTEEHKKKLLEMCNKLFPKHCKFEFFTEDLRFLNEETDEFLTFIHWFEFVFLYLVSALQNKMSDDQVWSYMPPYVGNVYGWTEGRKWTFYTKFMFHYPKAIHGGSDFPINPIDYLYEEFKKLK